VPTNKLIQATQQLLEGTFQSEPNPTLLGIWEILKKEMEDKDNNYQFSGDMVIKNKRPTIKTNDKIDFSKIYDDLYPENSDIAHYIFLGFCHIRALPYLNPDSFSAIWQNQDSNVRSKVRRNWDEFREFLKATSAEELKNLTSIGSRVEATRAAMRKKHPRGRRSIEPEYQQCAFSSNQQYAFPSNTLAVYIADIFARSASEEPPYTVSMGRLLFQVNEDKQRKIILTDVLNTAYDLFSDLFNTKEKRFWTLRELLNTRYNGGKLINSLPEERLSERARQCLEWEQMASLLPSKSFREWRVAFQCLSQLQKTNLLPVIRQGDQGDLYYVHIENFQYLQQFAEQFKNVSEHRAKEKALEEFIPQEVALNAELEKSQRGS
jgi:hypothetical protein